MSRLLHFPILLLLGLSVLAAEPVKPARTFPLVPIRIVVDTPVPESVFDGTDALSVQQEAILPGVIQEGNPPAIAVGVPIWWNLQSLVGVTVEAFSRDGHSISLKAVGVDERIGLLVARMPEGTDFPVFTCPEIPPSMKEKSASFQYLCLPGSNQFRLYPVREGKTPGRLYAPSDALAFPALFPVFSPSGSFQGFALPAPGGSLRHIDTRDIAFRVKAILASRANLVSGYMGLTVDEPRDPVHAEGLLVRSVKTGAPAEKAGILPGDLLQTLDGQPVRSSSEVYRVLGNRSPEEKIRLTLIREGKRHTLEVALGRRPADLSSLSALLRPEQERVRAVADWTEWLSSRHGHPAMGVLLAEDSQTSGTVRVDQILPGSPAEKAGMAVGDRILSIGGKPVHSLGEVTGILRNSQKGETLSVRIVRRESEITLSIVLE